MAKEEIKPEHIVKLINKLRESPDKVPSKPAPRPADAKVQIQVKKALEVVSQDPDVKQG